MTYRDEQAALAGRLASLEARLAHLRKARASLSDMLVDEQSVVAELHALRKQLGLSAADIRRRLPLVQQVYVASPCDVAWDSMAGDDKTRFCGECQKHVHNLSAMSSAEGEALLTRAEGELCVRLFRRADGTVLTQDCPIGLRAKKRRRLAAVAVLTGALAAAATAAFTYFRAEHGHMQPARGQEPQNVMVTAGAIAVQPPQTVQGGVGPAPVLPELGQRIASPPQSGGVATLPSNRPHPTVGRMPVRHLGRTNVPQ